tara:strand:- start:30 stop:2132 length:2103 start_codon:yes stop_codon:yes gene_type:complete
MADPKFTAIDTSTGAPKKVRAIVGNFDDPTRRLEAIKQYYPDAVSTAGTPMGEDNFIYTDPDTGQRTLYNPKGFDMGDVVSVGRDIFSGVGGAVGGAAALVGGIAGPQAATPEEFYTVPAAAALASEGAGQLYDRAVDAFLPDPFSVGRGGLVEQGTKAATNIGMEIVGGKLVEKGIDALKAAPGEITRRLAGVGKNRQATAQNRLREASELDVNLPSAGTVSQSPMLMFFERRMQDFPTSSPVVFEKFENFRTSAAQAVQNVASKYGRVVSEGGEIGESLLAGAEKGLAKFKKDQSKLYDAAFDLAPDATGRVNNIIELRSKLVDELSKAEKSLRPSMQAALDETDRLIADSQAGGGIDLKTLRQLRTNLRRKIDGLKRQGYGDSASYLDTVYASLTNDMKDSVLNYGGENANKALSKADIYTRNRQKFDVQPVFEKLNKDKKTGVQAFNFLMQGTKESGAQLKKILRNIPPAERGDIQASVLSRLGRTNPAGQDAIEEFSTAKFLTNYSKLADSAKDAFFGKGGNRAELDKLVAMFDDVKSADAFANNSRTGQSLGFMATLSPLAGGLGMIGQGYDVGSAATTAAAGLVGTALAPYVTSRLLTKPEFIRWLVKSGPQMGKNPNSTNFHLGRLMEIASRDSQFREDAFEYVSAFGQAFAPSSAEAATIEQPVEEVDVSTSPALQSLIETTNPALLSQPQ